MKIVIAGAKGMLGKALVEEFKKTHEVLAYDKEELDVTNKNQINVILEKEKPEVIINATAYNAVDKIEENSSDYLLAQEINGYVVGKLAEVCKDLQIVLVHYSSDYIFKGDNNTGYNESSFVDPINKYGETKVLGENLLKSVNGKFYLIRLSRLFGPTGDSITAKKSFVDIMLDLAVNQGKTQLDLVDDEKTCPTYSADLAKFTRELLEQHQSFGVYHGANSGACTWYEFAQEIFKLKKLNVVCNPVSGDKFLRPAKRPHFTELLNTKMPKQRSWQEALQEYLS